MAPLVGYWNIRGIAEPIYLIMEYLKVPYEKKIYDVETFNEWTELDKDCLGLDFPNLPYLIDGNLKLTQTLPIMKYIGRKYKLFGRGSNEEMAKEEEIVENIRDIRMKFASLCYRDGFEANKVGTVILYAVL